MLHVKLDSSCVVGADYDAGNAVMFIDFVNGRRYRYDDVPAAAFDALVTAESAGREFNARIRGRYAYEEIGRQPIPDDISHCRTAGA